MKSYSVVLIIGVIVTFLYSVFHDLKLRKKRKQVLEELTIALMKGDNQKYEIICQIIKECFRDLILHIFSSKMKLHRITIQTSESHWQILNRLS